jgi:hypothetical protein
MFSDDDRAIFEVEFSEGNIRHYDPYEVQNKLTIHCPNGFNRMMKKRWESWRAMEFGVGEKDGQPIQLSEEGRANAEREWAAAELEVCEAARKAFDLPAINADSGEGTPTAVVLSILDAFVDWRTQKKSSTSG